MATSYMDLLNMQPPGSGGSPGVVDLMGAGPVQGAGTVPLLNPLASGGAPNTLSVQGPNNSEPQNYQDLANMIAAFSGGPTAGLGETVTATQDVPYVSKNATGITNPSKLGRYQYSSGLVGPYGDTRSEIKKSRSGQGNWINKSNENPDWDEETQTVRS